MTPTTLAQVFSIAVVGETGIRLWLSTRQLRAVRTHRNSVPPLFRHQISLHDQQRAADYTVERVRLSRWATIYEGALKLLLTVGGGIAAIDTFFRHFNLVEPWLGLLIIGAFSMLLQLAGLPFAIFRTFKVEAGFGFNRSSPAMFATDWLKSLGLNLLLGIPVVLGALVLMQNGGPWWWISAWCGLLAWMTVMTWATPRYIAPIFNRFTPLEDGAIKTRLEHLLGRCGFSAAGGVFIMDGSRRSAHGNAYFTGIGRTKRIVILDTLLETLSPEEFEAVVAHELGHFRLHHITKRLISTAALTLIGLLTLAWAARQSMIFDAFGIESRSAEGALLLFSMATPLAGFFARPWISWLSRRQESAADDFAIQHTSSTRLADALIKLFRDNASTLTPDALHSAYFDSHPPALSRIKRLQMPREFDSAP
jgi:STE24 endopeptidase